MITLRFCVVDLVSAHTTTLLDSFFASSLPTTGVYTFQEWRTTCRMEVINSMSRHRDYYFHRLKTCYIFNIL